MEIPFRTEFAKGALVRIGDITASYPEVNVRLSHHTPTFFIRDKKVLCHLWELKDDRVALWCPAADGAQAELVESDPERFFVPKYVGHRGWIGLWLDIDPNWDEVDAVLRDAYRRAAPKTLARLLDGVSS